MVSKLTIFYLVTLNIKKSTTVTFNNKCNPIYYSLADIKKCGKKKTRSFCKRIKTGFAMLPILQRGRSPQNLVGQFHQAPYAEDLLNIKRYNALFDTYEGCKIFGNP